MRDSRPRRQFNFETIETSPELDYVPTKARDRRRVELFAEKPPGYVIAWQQMVGADASANAFTRMVDEGDMKNVSQLADVLSVASIGTAYHAFAVPEQDELMYRQIRIPEMVHPETKNRTSEAELIERAQRGLAGAAELAVTIEEMVHERRDPSKYNQKLGRALATTGFTLATIHDRTAKLRDDEVGMQTASWKASRRASARALELSGAVGARPTLAQLADEHSPLRRYINDNNGFVRPSVYGALIEEVGRSTGQAFEKRLSPDSRTLF